MNKGSSAMFLLHVLATFYEEMIFDEIRGYLVILPFYRAQTRASENPLRNRATKFEVEVLKTFIQSNLARGV